jgi:CheY-like chemotaxis protein
MPCVLIVEDDEDVREFMDLLLHSSGYETMTAANGLEALAKMRQRRPCVVLLDLAMPVMDGWTFRERQLQEPELASVPVVCVTAVYNPQEVVRRLHVRCLRKPVEFPSLLDEVWQMCGDAAL